MEQTQLHQFHARLEKLTPPPKLRRRRHRWRLPLKGLMLIGLAVFGFKIALILVFGNMSLQTRISAMENETALTRYAARIFKPDPVTQWVAVALKESL